MPLHTWMLVALAACTASAQIAGDWESEVHPRLTTWECTIADGCRPRNTTIVLDSAYHSFHVMGSTQSCLTLHGELDPDYCYDNETCWHNCRLEGANYTDAGVRVVNSATSSSLILDLYVHNINPI